MTNKIDTGVLFKDLHYNVNLDYDTYSDCEGEGCDGICRCSRIENAKVESIHYEALAEDIAPENLLTKYCVERILRHFKPLQDSSSWDVETEGGYYGEEIGKVKLNEDVAETLSNILLALEDASDDKKVELALTVEYGFVLPTLQAKSWSLEKVHLVNLELGQKEYAKNLDKKRIDDYTFKFEMEKKHNRIDQTITGVAIESGSKYRVIDGYHRVTAAKKFGKRVIWMLVGK